MMTNYYQLVKSTSYEDSLKAIEADIQYANLLAASIPRFKNGTCLQMKLVYSNLAPILLFLLQRMDCSCTCLLPSYFNLFHIVVYKVIPNSKKKIPLDGRKASIREFYAVLLPSLQRLHDSSSEQDSSQDEHQVSKTIVGKKVQEKKHFDADLEKEDECGICLELCTKIVLPNCYHAMCINCYRDWNLRSESCPFCRGNLKRVNSGDLWVLTGNSDIVDQETLSNEDMLRFYLYINSLPKDTPEALFLVYYEYLI
ncbi:E3 ubiquitin-protein ligase AIRP2 isoform X1 [Nicotiana tabacum]|uniref:E3 ubiquitin-protein ligase AIRP2 isoform X1 n=2 Tax=Nicotiana tabacum TaxID=4097 RepID=A0A1S3ZC11_TOBAC|nr:PREDICTED: peroxisome biogenesis factor 10-like isoform X1 [Nicotiana tabacum]